MASNAKRQSMAEALKNRDEVRTFLEEGRPQAQGEGKPTASTIESRPSEPRIPVTVRLPESIAHALIDESANRRKRREPAWSQQDIVAEALEILLARCG